MSTLVLRPLVRSVVGAEPARDDVRELLYVCRDIALAYLRQKSRRRRVYTSWLGICLEDVAVDCLGEIFRRDSAGRFPVLAEYYGGMSWESAGEQALFEATRRLVFGAVNERLFYAHGEVDPSLAKILRNLKRAVKSVDDVRVERIGPALFLRFGPCRPRSEALPIMPTEVLEMYLAQHVRSDTSIADTLRFVHGIFARQSHYRLSYPLTLFAQVLRVAVVRVMDASEPFEDGTSGQFVTSDIGRMVSRAVAETRAQMYLSYVGRGKMDEATYTLYFRAIEDRLNAQFSNEDATNYEIIQDHLGGLARDAYQQEHRPVFEYLTRVARQQLVNLFRQEYAGRL